MAAKLYWIEEALASPVAQSWAWFCNYCSHVIEKGKDSTPWAAVIYSHGLELEVEKGKNSMPIDVIEEGKDSTLWAAVVSDDPFERDSGTTAARETIW